MIQGPAGSPYEGGSFKLEIAVPDRYPFEPPKIRFMTPIYHPNIDDGGRICLDTLNMPPKGSWKPAVNLSTVLASVQQLVADPNPDDGLVPEITQEFKQDRALYDSKARAHTTTHAVDPLNATIRGQQMQQPSQLGLQSTGHAPAVASEGATRPPATAVEDSEEEEEDLQSIFGPPEPLRPPPAVAPALDLPLRSEENLLKNVPVEARVTSSFGTVPTASAGVTGAEVQGVDGRPAVESISDSEDEGGTERENFAHALGKRPRQESTACSLRVRY